MLVRASAVGTGYRITDDLVLTAHHLLGAGSGHCAIESHGAPEASARPAWVSHEKDLALLRLDSTHCLPPVASTRWGVLCSHHPDIPVEALGFPDFMADGRQRDYEQVTGFVNPLSALGQLDRLDVHVTSHTWRQGLGRPWRGMSGAPVFAGGCLLGVVVKAAGGAPRIAMVPVTSALEDTGFWSVLKKSGCARPVLEAADLPALVSVAHTPGALRSVAQTLRAVVRAQPLVGRDDLLDEMSEWAIQPGFACRLLIGPSGAGKTRFAVELGGVMREFGHVFAFVREYERDDERRRDNLRRLARLGRPILLTLDYAETRPDSILDLVEHLSANTGALPVKLLLLARSCGPWWSSVRGASAQVEVALADAACDTLPVLEVDEADRGQYFARAVDGLAGVLGQVPGYSEDQVSTLRGNVSTPDLSGPQWRTLTSLQIAALTELLSSAAPGTAPVSATAGEALLRHERRYWVKAARERGIGSDEDSVTAAFAYAALCGARNRDEARRLLTGTMSYLDAGAIARLIALIHDMADAQRSAFWPPMDSLLTELLITWDTDTDGSGLFSLAECASDAQLLQAATNLVRAAHGNQNVADFTISVIKETARLKFSHLLAIAAASAHPAKSVALIATARPEEAKRHKDVMAALRQEQAAPAEQRLISNAYLSAYAESPTRLARRAAANSAELLAAVHDLRRELRAAPTALDAATNIGPHLAPIAQAANYLSDLVNSAAHEEAAHMASAARRAAPKAATLLEPLVDIAGNLPHAQSNLLVLHDGLAVLERDIAQLADLLEQTATAGIGP